MIVQDLTALNIILSRPILNRIRAVIVPHLLLIKFVGDNRDIGTIYGNQQLARDCYLTTLDPLAWGATTKKSGRRDYQKVMKERIPSTTHNAYRRPEPIGEHYDVVLNLERPSKTVPIGISPEDPMPADLVR